VTASRFVTDTSLDFLARRLRFLGYDVLTVRGARLEELFEAAAREQRHVLTLSRRRSRRHPEVPCTSVTREDPGGALRAIASAHAPAGAPFSRCPSCNVALQRRTPFEAHGEVPGRVLRSGTPLTHCPSCGKWYWEGSHTARLRAWLERTMGRPIDPPGAAPGSVPHDDD
jgi:uncharacterized protein with PIN domain